MLKFFRAQNFPLVVQWIERRSSKAHMGVRFPPRGQKIIIFAFAVNTIEIKLKIKFATSTLYFSNSMKTFPLAVKFFNIHIDIFAAEFLDCDFDE